MAGERGPLSSPHARRTNKKPELGVKAAIVSRPTMPRTLDGEAKAEWRRIVPELERMGLLTTVDRAVLIRYCRIWANWLELDAGLQKTGMLIKGRLNGLVRNPLWLLRTDAEAMLSDLMKQLGLTPNARLRMAIVHEQPEEDAEAPGVAILDKYRAMMG